MTPDFNLHLMYLYTTYIVQQTLNVFLSNLSDPETYLLWKS